MCNINYKGKEEEEEKGRNFCFEIIVYFIWKLIIGLGSL